MWPELAALMRMATPDQLDHASEAVRSSEDLKMTQISRPPSPSGVALVVCLQYRGMLGYLVGNPSDQKILHLMVSPFLGFDVLCPGSRIGERAASFAHR